MDLITQFQKIDDAEIIEKISSGQLGLYEVIIRRYNPYLFKIGRSYGFNRCDTEDLIQDCFISAYAHLDQFEGRSSLKTWLVKIMLHECYQKSHRYRHKNELPSENLDKGNPVPMFSQRNDHTEKNILNAELKHVLENSLLRIPESYRMVFTLRELNGMSTKDTAEALEISESNVKVRLNRAKSMLRKEIEKMYTPEDIFEFNLVYCNRIVDKVLDYLGKK